MTVRDMSDDVLLEAMEGTYYEYMYAKQHLANVEQQYIRLWAEQHRREISRGVVAQEDKALACEA